MGTAGPLPQDHVKLLIGLLRPMGAELARRWVAALMMVPAEERLDVVGAVEERITRVYGAARESGVIAKAMEDGVNGEAKVGNSGAGDGQADERADENGDDGVPELVVRGQPVQREGYVEEREVVYSRSGAGKGAGKGANGERKRASG